ncbi:hypothetical protein EJ03DRAFT_274905 [Teratosphaeria nubilosa]|uniref:Uncharacterized protein n=1 Tax=Teratosphaeria nubilosa TaxID=161662 RepID=A0A6G1L598_9PEZI|nr:hypothetical protein EJ03DRAFT_274905 [Teratosphaeria nubilosa]
MGKAQKALKAFIEGIPESKLTNLTKSIGTLYKDDDFRLDMQGMTSDDPAKHNLQVQVNNGTAISTLKKAAPKTVAGPVLVAAGTSASDVRSELLGMMLI